MELGENGTVVIGLREYYEERGAWDASGWTDIGLPEDAEVFHD